MSSHPQKQRRALTTTRRYGRIENGGDAELSRCLARALRAPQKDDTTAESLTHPFHTYPARMHPATARELIEGLEVQSVLDPFCGSGTTLVEARAAGIPAVGADINPLAIAIANCKTWTVPRKRRDALLAAAETIAAETHAAGKAARRSGGKATLVRGNSQRDRALKGWFAPHVRRELEHMAHLIEQVERDDAELGQILRVAVSSILYKVSLRTSDTDPRKTERRVGRGAPARLFEQRVRLLIDGLSELSKVDGPRPTLLQADARDLSPKRAHAAAVITSPPYAGTYDYADQHSLRLAFFGVEDKHFARAEIGSRRSFAPDTEAGVQQWRRDLKKSIRQMARAVDGGPIALIMGDSVAGRRRVAADELIRQVLPTGIEVVAWAWQERPKVGTDHRVFTNHTKREHLIVLQRR